MAKPEKLICPTCSRTFEVGLDLIPTATNCPFDGTTLDGKAPKLVGTFTDAPEDDGA